jgi:hypothetical protein
MDDRDFLIYFFELEYFELGFKKLQKYAYPLPTKLVKKELQI